MQFYLRNFLLLFFGVTFFVFGIEVVSAGEWRDQTPGCMASGGGCYYLSSPTDNDGYDCPVGYTKVQSNVCSGNGTCCGDGKGSGGTGSDGSGGGGTGSGGYGSCSGPQGEAGSCTVSSLCPASNGFNSVDSDCGINSGEGCCYETKSSGGGTGGGGTGGGGGVVACDYDAGPDGILDKGGTCKSSCQGGMPAPQCGSGQVCCKNSPGGSGGGTCTLNSPCKTSTGKDGTCREVVAGGYMGLECVPNSGTGPSNPAPGGSGGCPEGFQKQAGVCFPTNSGLSQQPIIFLLARFMDWILAIFGMLAIIAFVISGIQYLVAVGDDDAAKTAKRNMQYSILGVIVALSGWIIIQAVTNALAGSWFF